MRHKKYISLLCLAMATSACAAGSDETEEDLNQEFGSHEVVVGANLGALSTSAKAVPDSYVDGNHGPLPTIVGPSVGDPTTDFTTKPGAADGNGGKTVPYIPGPATPAGEGFGPGTQDGPTQRVVFNVAGPTPNDPTDFGSGSDDKPVIINSNAPAPSSGGGGGGDTKKPPAGNPGSPPEPSDHEPRDPQPPHEPEALQHAQGSATLAASLTTQRAVAVRVGALSH